MKEKGITFYVSHFPSWFTSSRSFQSFCILPLHTFQKDVQAQAKDRFASVLLEV